MPVLTCTLCGCALTERQRLGSHACCDPCLLASLDNSPQIVWQDEPGAHVPVWLPFMVAIALCGFMWGFVWML